MGGVSQKADEWEVTRPPSANFRRAAVEETQDRLSINCAIK